MCCILITIMLTKISNSSCILEIKKEQKGPSKINVVDQPNIIVIKPYLNPFLENKSDLLQTILKD
jgi:hypothetical protein